MVDGFVVVDKPPGCTSHDVVAQCRRVFAQRRVGHGGTLDPDATGVLLVGLGRATRLLRFLTSLPKSYTGEVVLGTETSTLDSGGEVVATHDMAGVTLADVREAVQRFMGPIEQVPPMVSAVKIDGRRLYTLAREGVEVERVPRSVTVHRFEVAPGSEAGVFAIDVTCSSGTYVRSLAADLGRALGGGAHLRNLRRTAVGSFDVASAVPLAALGPEHVLPPAAAMRDYGQVTVDTPTGAVVAHGAVLDADALPGASGEGPWAVVDEAGSLLAVYERHGQRFKPAVVVAS